VTAVQVQMAAGRVLIINMYNHIAQTDSISCVLQTMHARERMRAGRDTSCG